MNTPVIPRKFLIIVKNMEMLMIYLGNWTNPHQMGKISSLNNTISEFQAN